MASFIEPEVKEFTEAVGAKEIEPGDELYRGFREIFKRRNYFLMRGTFLIIKVSRVEKPFYGIDKKIIDLLNNLEQYHLVLLTTGKDGWVFSKNEVNKKIERDEWRLRRQDNNYKINTHTLKHENSFSSHAGFLKLIGKWLLEVSG